MEKKFRNCFVSYHHEYDQDFLAELTDTVGAGHVIDHSLHEDISHLQEESIYKRVREKMRECSITVVLVGERTGHRKWIDWEIWASLRAYTHPSDSSRSFKPSGLLAVFLPTAKHSIPKRLTDNIISGYAVCIKWENLHRDFSHALDHAYNIRMDHAHRIENSRRRQRVNYRETVRTFH